MKQEEIKKLDEQQLDDEQLDEVAGGKPQVLKREPEVSIMKDLEVI